MIHAQPIKLRGAHFANLFCFFHIIPSFPFSDGLPLLAPFLPCQLVGGLIHWRMRSNRFVSRGKNKEDGWQLAATSRDFTGGLESKMARFSLRNSCCWTEKIINPPPCRHLSQHRKPIFYFSIWRVVLNLLRLPNTCCANDRFPRKDALT